MTGLRYSSASALAAAILLAVPVTGLAQTRPRAIAATRATPSAEPRDASATEPARPSPAEPASPASPIVEQGSWRIAAILGRESDGDADLAGLRVGVELERDLVALGRRGQLSFVAPVGWFHATRSVSAAAGGVTTTTDTTFDLFELVPSFRASFALAPRLRLFAETGIGVSWARTGSKTSSNIAPDVASKIDDTAGVLRFGAGGSYQLNDRVRIGVLAPTISKRYGRTSSQTVSFSATAAYAF